MTPYQKLVAAWKNCELCGLHVGRKQVVFARGKLPAEVAFIGEAPGDSEDRLGVPFIGPAGKLLDKIIERAEHNSRIVPSKCWFNIVGCEPKDEDNRKRGEPRADEIKACAPRLERFLGVAKPKLVVCVGQLSAKQAKANEWSKRYKVVEITHPAALLRMDVGQKGLAIDRCIVVLEDAFADLDIPF